MTTTWDEINDRLSLFLDDAGAATHPLPLRAASWNWAQRVYAQHTARECETDLVLDPDHRQALVPPDLMEVSAIYDHTNLRFWSPAHFQQGGFRDDVTEEGFEYWTWGGKLHLERCSIAGTKLTLYYYAYWPDVELEIQDGQALPTQPDILVPDWAELPLVHLAAANVLQPMAIASARGREYNIMVDSGKPTDNARAQQAREHYWWWNELINRFPAQPRMGGVTR